MTAETDTQDGGVGAESSAVRRGLRLSTPSSRGATVALFAAIAACVIVLLAVNLPREVEGGVALVLMLLLIALGVPVGLGMILAGALGIASVGGWSVMISALETAPFRAVASWPLTVLPMFILMGILLYRSGVTARIYNAARVWTNWLPGGLAITTNFAGAGLAALSGSTLAITYALGRLAIPEMLRSGYDSRLAVGPVLMAGTGGQLLPPSILMVVYAGVADTPVGQQLLAGVAPGLLLPLGFALTISVVVLLRPHYAPKERHQPQSLGAKLRVTAGIWPTAVLIVIVAGGIFSGVFTATEAGAYGAFVAAIIAIAFGGMKRGSESIRLAVIETAGVTAAIMLLFIGAEVLTRMLTLSGLSVALTENLAALPLSQVQFLLLLVVVYLIMGMFIDATTMVILTVPLLLPVLQAYDVSLLWFGAFIVLIGELAVITPPVGMLSFVVHKIAMNPEVSDGRSISLGQVFQSAIWMLPSAVLILILMILVPEFVTWIPEFSAAE